jgi:hypothetical protein
MGLLLNGDRAVRVVYDDNLVTVICNVLPMFHQVRIIVERSLGAVVQAPNDFHLDLCIIIVRTFGQEHACYDCCCLLCLLHIFFLARRETHRT